MLGTQFVGNIGLVVLAGIPLLLMPTVIKTWLVYIFRAKWLLLTLWLILAYNAPGEAWLDQPWAPTYEGIGEGTLHAARLLVMLMWLAWLFAAQGRSRLVSGLWGLLQPFAFMGLEVERLVVRLTLVLENLQTQQEAGAWRRVLDADARATVGPGSLSLIAVPWSVWDTLVVMACVACLLGVLVR